ncbi:MAG: hypothetical protein QME75_14870 [Deltaproteobacteria bacterium]|nr:hypothetical protein [Deltaproteobacteria bacterium]
MDRLEWERLDERGSAPFNLNTVAARAKVPGGWVFRYVSLGEREHIYVCFIPDPEYAWEREQEG